MSSMYQINKGVNKPIVFKGLKAQYIWWLGIGLTALLLLFAILYIAGVAVGFCLVVVFGLGAVLFRVVFQFSKEYGEHGLMKKMAASAVPKYIKFDFLFQ